MHLLLELEKARKVKVQPGQMALWVEEEHPRKPAGSEGGGEFVSKGEAVENGPTYRHKFTGLEFQVTHRKEPEQQGHLPVYTGTVTKQGTGGFAKFKEGDNHSASAIQLVNHYDKIDGGSLAKPETKPNTADTRVLHTFTNGDVNSFVATQQRGGFGVTLQDIESGDFIGHVNVYPTEAEAINAAKKIVGQQDDDQAYQDKLHTALDDVRLQAQSRRGTLTRAAEFGDLPADEQVQYFNQIILPIYKDTGEPTKGEGRYLEFQDRVAAHFRNGGQMDAEETGGASLGANPSSGRSEAADTGPLYHDTYTGPRFTYGGEYRPLGYAAIPNGWIINSNREHPDFETFGTIDFPRELTPEEVASYQLHPVAPKAEKPAAEPAWKVGEARYQHLRGVHQPHIGEISGQQMARMGKQQRAAYDKKRAAEWQASGDVKDEYAQKVREAFKAGEVSLDHADLHPDAKRAILRGMVEEKQQNAEEAFRVARETNNVTSADQIKPGDRVWNVMFGAYINVDKVVRGRVHGKTDSGHEHNAKFGTFQFLNHNDLKAQAEAGLKKSLVLTLTPEDLEKAARRPTVPSGQQGFSFDEAAHPRLAAGQHEGKLHGGEFTKKPGSGDGPPQPKITLSGAKKPARTDVHRPAEMVPGDYEYLAASFGVETDHGTEIEWDGSDEWKKLGQPTDGTAAHSQPGKCDHCGAHHKYQVLLRHKGTGEIVSVGHQCYANRFEVPEWQNLVADKARRAEVKAKRAANIERGRAAMTEEERAAHDWATGDAGHPIAADMARKLAEFGPLSDKQKQFMVKLHTEAKAKEAAKAEEVKGEPVPSGKQTVRGVVLGLKVVDSGYGSTTKMLVQDERGFKVWGTRPGAIGDAEKGATVEFTGTLQPSGDDPHFGFFSRPTKARYTGDHAVAAESRRAEEKTLSLVMNMNHLYPKRRWTEEEAREALNASVGSIPAAARALLVAHGLDEEAARDYPDLAKAISRDPMLLLKAKAQPGQMGFAWDEEAHPRKPAGGEHGGEFVKKPEGGNTDTKLVISTPKDIKNERQVSEAYRVKAWYKGKVKPVTVIVNQRYPSGGMATAAEDGEMNVARQTAIQGGARRVEVHDEHGGVQVWEPETPVKSEPKEAKVKPIILGINDDVTTCEKCGKTNLKKTVVLDFGEGDPQHYGSDCAAFALLGSKSSANRKKIDLQAAAMEWALRRMKETGDPDKVAGEIQGRLGYGKVGMSRGGLDIADVHIREDGSIGEPLGPLMTADLLARIQNMVRSGRFTVEQIAEMRGATVSQVLSVARSVKKYAHEPLGGNMPSHVPVGTSTPMTETPTPTNDFRFAKSALLLLNVRPFEPIARE